MRWRWNLAQGELAQERGGDKLMIEVGFSAEQR
jgi:hypothetical protein